MGKYTGSDIEVLEGVEAVRKRPAMYIGGTDWRGYHHLLWEIVDNSVDEAINGHASRIDVTIHKDLKSATISDNGRGIPIDKHPKHKKPALELVMTTLHAGGKFEGKNYKVSGGLHGVGSSVVNALSEETWVVVKRAGREHKQTYSRGHATSKLKKGPVARGTGTTTYFRPDPKIFGKTAKFDPAKVRERLLAKSYLHKGLKIIFKDEKGGTREEFENPEGVAGYLKAVVAERGKARIHPEPFVLERLNDPRLEVSLQWTESSDEHIKSFANGIPTAGGGTHESGLKQALTKAVRAFMSAQKMKPRGVTITADDIREGVVAIISAYVEEPQFQGQTKDRLNNPEIAAPTESAVRTALEQWLLDNKSIGDAIVGRIVLAARAREASRAASKQVMRKSPGKRVSLPGKLSDCQSSDPSQTELFLVEGDSAGGNAKQGRDRRFQAILPLRGKVLNAERASAAQVLNNRELKDIVSALGCGIGAGFDINRLRYNRIFLLMDADVDGHHIATLLLTFFYRMLPGLIREGHLYLALPPLYRLDIRGNTHWAVDDEELNAALAKYPSNAKYQISRFKGLGEMTATELKETTLAPGRRRAVRVRIEGEVETDQVVNDLMGKDAAPRYAFIMEHAPKISADELDL